MMSRTHATHRRHAFFELFCLSAICWLATASWAMGQFERLGPRGAIVQQPAESNNPASAAGGSPLDVDRRLKQWLSEAEEYLANGKTSNALQLWQAALTHAKNMLTTREDWNVKISDREYVIYRSITSEIERRIAKLPPEDLRLYRQTYDADAQALLKLNPDQMAALEDLVNQYFLSTHGDDSAYYLAMLWFDQGDYARSARMLQKIVTDYPDSNVSPKQLRLRLALTSARMRDVASAEKYWAEYRELSGGKVPDSVRLIYQQELARAARSPVASKIRGETWPMQLGGASRNKDMPILPPGALDEKLSENWIMPFETQLEQTMPNANSQGLVFAGGQVVQMQIARTSSRAANTIQRKPLDEEWRANGWMPARQLYFENGRMFINGNNRVICLDAADGRVLWMGRKYQYLPDDTLRYYAAYIGNTAQGTGRGPATLPEIRLFGDRLHPLLTIEENTVYALEGEILDYGAVPRDDNAQNTAYRLGMRRSRSNWLAAYEASTGKLKWHRSPQDAGDETGDPQNGVGEALGFLAAPVPFGDHLLIPVSNKGELWLYSLHKKTGETDWKVFLWDEPMDGVSPWSAVGTAIEGGDIYLSTGMGLVFALDAATGKVHWANRYPRKGTQVNANVRGFNPLSIANAAKNGWMEDVLIPFGNHLVVLPSDYDYIITLDRRTGDLLWDSCQVPFDGDPRANYCLGISGDDLFVGGREIIRKYNIPTGKLIWEQPIGNSLGQAALTADAVYAPNGDEILQLDLDTGEIVNRTDVFTPTGEPVGNLFSDGRHLYGVGMQRVYALASLTDRMKTLSRRIAEGDGHSQLTRMQIHLQRGTLEDGIRDLEGGSQKIRQREGLLHGLVALYGGLAELIPHSGNKNLTEVQPETALRLMVEAHPRKEEPIPEEQVSEPIGSTLEKQRSQLISSALQTIQTQQLHAAFETVLAAANLCTTQQLEGQVIRTVTSLARPEHEDLLETALKEGEVPARLAAAEALLKQFPDRAEELAKTLLNDSADRVRLRGVKVLANQGDRKVLPILGNLLESEDLGVRVQSASLLRALTKQNFRFTAYDKPEARAEVVAKWKKWIETEGRTAPLTYPIQFQAHLRGRTLYTNYNLNSLHEMDEKGNEVWKKTGVAGAWSCQGLENGNRLVTSYRSRSVHEFDESGNEVWKKDGLPGYPYSIQRLDNGNTLISCSNQRVYEYSPEGEVAWEVNLTGIPRSAQRLDNGNTLISLFNTNDVVEVDPQGKIVWRVGNMNSPLTAQRLPNGNTLVVQHTSKQIVELDANGKTVWTKQWSTYLHDAQRLENGNTLIADNTGLKEIDQDGKVVYQKLDTGIRGISRY
jgi:outer membrane protein assembly factor BamB/TolA-binding protein